MFGFDQVIVYSPYEDKVRKFNRPTIFPVMHQD